MGKVQFLALLLASFAFSIPSDDMFEPPDLVERMNPVPYSERTCSDREGYETGQVLIPILAGNDVVRSGYNAVSVPYSTWLGGHVHNGADFSIAITRLSPEGILDTSFMTNGIFTRDISASDDLLHGLAVHAGSAASFVGRSRGPADVSWLVGRVKSTGLDTAFNTVGYRVGTFVNGGEIFRAIIPMSANRAFFASGYVWQGGKYLFAIAAYNSNGSLDTSFANQGYRLDATSSFDNGALSLGIDTHGAVTLLAGGPSYTGTDWDFAFIRYNTEGRLDTSFNTDGMSTIAILGGDDKNYSVILSTSTPGFYSGGYAHNGADNDFAVVRLRDSDGGLDTGFHSDGKVTNDFSTRDDVIFDMAWDAIAKKIYAVGSTDNGVNLDVALVRYHTNGNLDTAFHTDGLATFDVSGGNDVGASVKQFGFGGKLFVGARSVNGANQDFAMLRVESDGSLAVSGMKSNSYGTSGVMLSNVGGTDILYNSFIETLDRHMVHFFGKSGTDITIGAAIMGTGLDTSFDTDGIKIFDLGGVEQLNGGMAGDGLAMNSMAAGNTATDILVVRLGWGAVFWTGGLDTAFSTDGYDTLDISGNDVAYGITTSYIGFGNDGGATTNAVLFKYVHTAGGKIDTSFHTDGMVTYNPSGTSTVLKFGEGLYFAGNDTSDFVAFNIKTDGTLSTAFDTDGAAIVDFGGNETLGGMVLDANMNRLVLAGGDGSDFLVARVTSRGMMDTAFSTDGKQTIDFGGNETAMGVKLNVTNQKIIVGGDNGTDYVIARLLTDGRLDTTFSTDGKVTVDGTGVDVSSDLYLNKISDICILGAGNGGLDSQIVCISQ